MSSFNYRDHIVTGTSSDALDWIKSSSLDEEDKNALNRFVNRFPDVIFYKENDSAIDYVEQRYNVRLPLWLRNIRKTLAYIEPDERVMFQVDRFDGWSPRSDVLNEIWYFFALIGYSDDEDREILEPEKLFPVAYAWRTGRSILAIKMENNDINIYEYNMQDLWDNVSEDVPAAESIRSVLGSYTVILDRIVAIQYLNGDTVQALQIH